MWRRTFEEESKIFGDMFFLAGDADPGEGSSAKNPIVLSGVKENELRALLKVLYPP